MVDSDVNASLPHSKKQRHFRESNPFEVEDRISSLPDTILCSILSFLPTQEAIRTSVLSKKWKYRWTSLSNITLDDSPLNPYKKGDQYEAQIDRFVNFVDGVIFRHDESNIEKFCLSFAVPIEQPHVNAWISAVLSHRVQELVLTLSLRANYEFHFSLFNFKTLTVLHLQNCSLKISTATRFETLKTCGLVDVTFLDDPSTQCLFPHCPVLEDLVLDNCFWKKWATFIFAIPSLKRFKLNFDDLYFFVKIYAPKLEDLELNGCFTWVDWVLWDLRSLVNVSVDYLINGIPDDEKAERVIRLLKAIRVVKSLQIQDTILGIISLFSHLQLVNCIPTFHNLTHLEVLFDDSFTDGVNIMRILLRSPKLESLSIDASRQTDWFWVNDEWMKYSAPPNFKPVLKEVSMDGFHGNPAEIHFLEVLLKHSVSLERVDVFCHPFLSKNLENKEEVNNILQMLPRASSSCVIELH